jgi:hypothetical protein
MCIETSSFSFNSDASLKYQSDWSNCSIENCICNNYSKWIIEDVISDDFSILDGVQSSLKVIELRARLQNCLFKVNDWLNRVFMKVIDIANSFQSKGLWMKDILEWKLIDKFANNARFGQMINQNATVWHCKWNENENENERKEGLKTLSYGEQKIEKKWYAR